MKILVTNDDGVLAGGLKTLAQAACRFGEVVVYAPEEKCSGMSRAITISGSLHIKPVFLSEGFRAYSVSGTPADCVSVAVNGMNERPDLILSGINNGYNLGHDIVYSGTVAAAREGAEAGIRSVAFSQPPCCDFTAALSYYEQIMQEVLSPHNAHRLLTNVNFPDPADGECRGIRWNTRLSALDLYRDSCIRTDHADGSCELNISSVHSDITQTDCDITAVMDGFISVGYLSVAEFCCN